MKEDHKDIIITPGRYGKDDSISRRAEKSHDLEKMENLPEREGMKARLGWDRAMPSDYLKPLRRLIDKNVDRPWDKVYSELTEHADARNLRGWHFREHIWMEVDKWNIRQSKIYGTWWTTPQLYYIDQKGFLRKDETLGGKSWKCRKDQKESAELTKFVHDDTVYEKIKGIWYVVWYKEVERPDFFHFDHKEWDKEQRRWIHTVISKKLQLNKKELKELGIKNDEQSI